MYYVYIVCSFLMTPMSAMVPVYETLYRILLYKHQIWRILEHVDEEDVMPILDVVDTEWQLSHLDWEPVYLLSAGGIQHPYPSKGRGDRAWGLLTGKTN